ncbi:uncharacterized protein LOC143203482 isoform X2 [Rhynchophorus ferrugineus]|uniref:uncharacterized protein LOC143203482 isoform X2 n=1 Tax=Rhynchophorus ferrugineus TaxID=354439 RepID=UPI003FCCDC89
MSVGSVGSGDSLTKKKAKGLVKARAAARRTALANESSSDDDSSLRSNSSLKMRSEESLSKPSDPGHSRKSRAARTERYLKRHSRDGENPHNYLRLSKSDADDARSLSRSPNMPRPGHVSISSSNMSGLSTIPPAHNVQTRYIVSNSTSNPCYKPPLSMNDYNSSQRSISCDANIHKAPSFEDNNVLHVQLPIMRPNARNYRNLSFIEPGQVNCLRQPPQPPPRDPNRTVVSHYFENGRPSTFYLDGSVGQSKTKPFHGSGGKIVMPKASSFNLGPSWRSNSEVHIPTDPFQLQTPVRPASTTPEPKCRYITPREQRHTVEGYNYLADKHPRSRKPIVIQSSAKVEPRKDSPTQKALEFWKQREENIAKPAPKPTTSSPQIFTGQAHVQSQVFLPTPQQNGSSRNPSPFKPVSPTVKEVLKLLPEDSNRKSANLEDALNELEAIYNSLRLGDENLLERAEQREKETLIQRAEEAKKVTSRGALSDSSFSYEPFDQVDSPKKRRLNRRAKIPDTKEDDMYNRRLVREKPGNIAEPQAAVSAVSYLMASPIQAAYDSDGEYKKELRTTKEPDVTFDDVAYRNLRHAQASHKVTDCQPPFGIPLGPVAPSPNSDYLHATSQNVYLPLRKQTKIPDIVKDDLAFRNLRKDSNKDAVLPQSSLDMNYLKKRRAVRSLSANIGNILGKPQRNGDGDVENEFRNKTLTDIADAMEIARQVLQEKGKNISNTKMAFMSDTEVRPSSDAFRESRRKFLDGLKDTDNQVSSRPPKGLTPERKLQRTPTKESAPVVKPPVEDEKSTNSSLDDLLNALAEEAKVTTERITKELEELEKKRNEQEATELESCQKLLKAVVDNNHPTVETVQEINLDKPSIESAVLVQSCFESEHDYENIHSADEAIDVEQMERDARKEVEAHAQDDAFREPNEDVGLTKSFDDDEDRPPRRRFRLRLNRLQRPISCPDEAMSENHRDSRATRIARYKEERRKQLAEQFGNVGEPGTLKGGSSSSSDGPRPTRASHLRAQAATTKGGSASSTKTEKSVSPLSDTNRNKQERDKSSKRKSNLNRSLNSEEVPAFSLNDPKTARRRRRFFPQDVLDQTPRPPSSRDTSTASATSSVNTPSTARFTAPTSLATSTTTHATSESPPKQSSKRSGISVHMENARRSVTSPSTPDTHKYKPFVARTRTQMPTTRERPISSSATLRGTTASVRPSTSASDNETNRNIAKRMEELKAFTRETLAKVERLTNRTKDLQVKRPSPVKQMDLTPSSILKRKPREEKETVIVVVNEAPVPTHVGPVSILKRKVAQDEKTEAHSTPVTFSPNVVEPTTTNRKQGILKKRRSLDESTVMRHRSCSPDVANKSSDSKSILKSQRRSSLEELRRTQSPEVHIQGILKRKPKTDDDDQSLNSPQGILKRRSGASSAGSTTNTPHVSITTAVILAAAGGAEMILEPEASQEPVKPILKKKSSEEHSFSENSADAPKPILKKKSSTDTDDGEEKPMKPILKLPRNSVEREVLDTGQDVRYSRFSSLDSTDDVKPILKTTSLRAESPRPRLSFCGDATPSPVDESRARTSRRSYTICSDFNVTSNAIGRGKEDDRDLKKARPLSVLELIKTFEKNVNTDAATGGGAIPKKRSGDRYRTQPVTSNELEASRILLTHSNQRHAPQSDDRSPRPSQLSYHAHNTFSGSSRSLDAASFDFTSPLENESRLSSFLSSSFQAVGVSPESPACHKTSSDSAFQSLGDGLELEEPLDETEEGPNEMSLASQMRSLAEEAKLKRQERDQSVIERRGILKASHTGETSTPLAKTGQSGPRSALRRRDSPPTDTTRLDSTAFDSGRTESAFQRVKPSRTETCADKDDEGISCNDSGSDSEVSEAKSKSQRQAKSGLLEDTTSEGESSGGREVRSIFKNENTRLNLNFKQQLEGVLAKSKSHSTFIRISPSCETNAGNFEEPASLGEGTRKSGTNLRRSHTHTAGAMPRSIADRRAKLQENGEKGWMRRVATNNNSCDELKLLKDKNRYNDELSEKTLLASKKDQLNAASNQWKSRVEKSDAEKFSVAGKMEKIPTINISLPDKKKGPPQAKRFRGKNGTQDASSTPSSPEKITPFDLTRSKSALSPLTPRSDTESESKVQSRVVSVNRPDDDTFTTFFQSVEQVKTDVDQLEVKLEDFDAVERQSLLIYKKNVQIRRRREATKNPIKALATRTDIADEYTEVITGVAEREKKRLNIEKLAQNSNKAVEALAGLASKEDFKAIELKKGQTVSTLVPWKSPMLLQVKGRRHVQTRLVEPVAATINEGDCYLLVTTSVVYNYIGAYANVIEQSRATDVANHIHKTNDLGCRSAKIVNVSSKDVTKRHLEAFWKILGSDSIPETVDAGHPDEDGTYESNILQTNMVYTIEDDELVPMDDYWGAIPKVSMLTETNVIVFDFGSEMYVWSGKNASLAKKNLAMKLAKELWEEGFDYSKCSVNPLNVANALGERPRTELPLTGDVRPPWAMFAKITQHRETVLFREKFLDWPDFSRVIRVRNEDGIKRGKGSIEIKPCNVDDMAKDKGSRPDLEIGTVHLGRGDQYFDEETRRLFQYDTVEIKAWRIQENSHEQLEDASIGQFYDGDSYIYSWKFRHTVMGRELNGKPSKHAQTGRDMTVFFCWHGNNSSVNEKCTAAFLTVELDKQNAPQIRVVQGAEPAAFLRLFRGSMMIHKGKRNEVERADASRLFVVRGEVPEEIYFMEVPLDMSSLRSRTSLVLLNPEEGQATVWHGCKATEAKREVAKSSIRKILDNRPPELFLDDVAEESLEVVEIEEGSESEDFLDTVGNDRTSYFSLLESDARFDYSPRLFRMSSITGNFIATEILCPHRSDNTTPYPFVQSELYQGSQPGLLLFDNHHELWLWQGWWPEKGDSEANTDQTGSGAVRWQAERRAAMQTALNYWKKKHAKREEPEAVVAHLVWAGLEPLEFSNLFPAWEVREDVRDLNLKDGKTDKNKISLQAELALLSRTTYPLAEILQRPLPEGVDPTQLEIYLSDDDFKELMGRSKQEFEQLPAWKKTALKKEKGLF